MSIVLDNREHTLISLLPNTSVQQLPVGDAWIVCNDKTKLVIERKTTADFEASFLDGRYREQRTRLLAYCSEQNAKALYILEGGLDGKRRSLDRPALQKLLHRLMLRYGIAVYFTKSTEDTAETLKLLSQQLSDDITVFEGGQVSYTDVQHVTKRGNKEDPKVFACAALQGCSGISAKSASAIWDAVGASWQRLLEITEKELAEIKVGERRLGPAVAKRLWAFFHGGIDSKTS